MVERRAPGPTGRQALTLYRRLRREPPNELLIELFETYGDVVRIPLGVRAFFLIRRPEHVEHVLVSNQQNYGKAFTYRPLVIVVSSSVLQAMKRWLWESFWQNEK